MSKKVKEDDLPPIIRVESPDSGIAYYPRYVKNEEGEWELKDQSFQKMFMLHSLGKLTSKEEV